VMLQEGVALSQACPKGDPVPHAQLRSNGVFFFPPYRIHHKLVVEVGERVC